MADPQQTPIKAELNYEQTFDNGRRSLIRRGPDFTLTITPRPNIDTVVSLLAVAMLVVFCLVGACWPAGTTRFAGGVVEHPGGVAPRVFFLVITGLGILSFVSAFRHFRWPTTVELEGPTLTVATPGFLRRSERRVDLTLYDRVALEIVNDEGPLALVLSGPRGTDPVTLLSIQGQAWYTSRDLDHVRRLVRRAIVRRRRACRVRVCIRDCTVEERRGMGAPPMVSAEQQHGRGARATF
jgi:hypothetical protein